MKLLIIDESAFDRSVMEKVFSGFYEMYFAATSTDSLIKCKKHQPDVVYCELRTPDLSILRSICDTVSVLSPAPPLIIAASENSVELERYARIRQVFYFLIRPFNLGELWDALESASSFALANHPASPVINVQGRNRKTIQKNHHIHSLPGRIPYEPKQHYPH